MRESRKHAIRHGEAVILFDVGPYTFAAPAQEVDEIRDLHGIQSVSSATSRTSVSKVKSIFERGSKTYYVVDASQHFRLAPSTPTRLMVLRSSPVAVLVDSIDRMAEIERTLPLPQAFGGEERKWYRALALVNGRVIPVVNIPPFLTAADQVIAKSIVGKLASGVTV